MRRAPGGFQLFAEAFGSTKWIVLLAADVARSLVGVAEANRVVSGAKNACPD